MFALKVLRPSRSGKLLSSNALLDQLVTEETSKLILEYKIGEITRPAVKGSKLFTYYPTSEVEWDDDNTFLAKIPDTFDVIKSIVGVPLPPLYYPTRPAVLDDFFRRYWEGGKLRYCPIPHLAEDSWLVYLVDWVKVIRPIEKGEKINLPELNKVEI